MKNHPEAEKCAAGLPVSPGASPGAVLRAARKRSRMTMEELASRMGVTRFAVRNWEGNVNRPDYDSLIRLCGLLRLSVQDLFPAGCGDTALERGIIQDVRRMKSETRILASALLRAMADEDQAQRALRLKESFSLVPLYSTSVAAGLSGQGSSFPEDAPAPFFLKRGGKAARAEAVIRVSGRSMEPEYRDGDYVFFEYASSGEPGEDLVVAVAGQAFIKRMSGSGRLCSLNSDFPFRYDGDGGDIRILGRVLGVVGPEETAEEADAPLLQEVFHAELAAFEARFGG